MTKEGQELKKLTEERPWEQARPLWDNLSKAFAEGAKGEVHVFHKETKGVHLNSIWRKVEHRILKSKKLIYHNIF